MHPVRLAALLLSLLAGLVVAPAIAAEATPVEALLLEAGDGPSGALSFSGTVRWYIAEDAEARPALAARVVIPERGLELSLLLHLNADTSLPASHLFELGFTLRDAFPGERIASVPGLLLKSERLVPGKPLSGASARVEASNFLYALLDSPEDRRGNLELLRAGHYLDIALIYGTGRRALLTLERDARALGDFADVERLWGGQAAYGPFIGPAALLVTLSSPAAAAAERDTLETRHAEALNGRSIDLVPLRPLGQPERVALIVRTGSLQEAVSLCADIAAAGDSCDPVADRVPLASAIDPKALPN